MLVILPSQDLKEVVFHHPLTPRYQVRVMRYFQFTSPKPRRHSQSSRQPPGAK